MPEKDHESYVLVSFSRVSGSKANLFGSPLRNHESTVQLRIARAVEHTEATSTRYHSREEILRLEMSASQFAALITTMNMGSGVPATLIRYQGQAVENPPETLLEHERLVESINEDGVYAQRIHDHLEEAATFLEEVLKRPSIRKKDVQEALQKVNAAQREVKSNLPYLLERFRKSCEKVKTSVMSEVDAWMSHAVHRAGLTVLQGKKQPKMLKNTNDT